MARATTLLVSGVLWAVMMAGLVSREVIPYLEYQSMPTYRAALQDEPRMEKIVRGVFEGNDRVGESVTFVFPGSSSSTRLATRFRMSLGELPKGGRLEATLHSTVILDAAYHLESFRASGRILYPVELRGQRVEGGLRVEGSLGKFKTESVLPFERGEMLWGATLPQVGIGRPEIGRQWKARMLDFDLLAGKPMLTTVYASIEEKTVKPIRGRDVPCYRVGLRKDLSKEVEFAQLWVDEEGQILMEETEGIRLGVAPGKTTFRIELEERSSPTSDELTRHLADFQE